MGGAAGASAAAGAGAAAAIIAQAIKAWGAIVKVEPQDFQSILDRQPEPPLVVEAVGGFFKKHYQYLTSYKGLFFYTKSPTQLPLPQDCEVVVAAKIWIPQ